MDITQSLIKINQTNTSEAGIQRLSKQVDAPEKSFNQILAMFNLNGKVPKKDEEMNLIPVDNTVVNDANNLNNWENREADLMELESILNNFLSEIKMVKEFPNVSSNLDQSSQSIILAERATNEPFQEIDTEFTERLVDWFQNLEINNKPVSMDSNHILGEISKIVGSLQIKVDQINFDIEDDVVQKIQLAFEEVKSNLHIADSNSKVNIRVLEEQNSPMNVKTQPLRVSEYIEYNVESNLSLKSEGNQEINVANAVFDNNTANDQAMKSDVKTIPSIKNSQAIEIEGNFPNTVDHEQRLKSREISPNEIETRFTAKNTDSLPLMNNRSSVLNGGENILNNIESNQAIDHEMSVPTKLEEGQPLKSEVSVPNTLEDRLLTQKSETPVSNKLNEGQALKGEVSVPKKVADTPPVKIEFSRPDKLEDRLPVDSEVSVPNKLVEGQPQKSEVSVSNMLEDGMPVKSEASLPNKLEEGQAQKGEVSVPKKVADGPPVKIEFSRPNKLDNRQPLDSEVSVPNKLEEGQPLKREISEPEKLEGRQSQKSEVSEPEKLEGRQSQKSEVSVPDKLEGRQSQKSEVSEPNKLEGRQLQKSEVSEPNKLEGRQPQKSEVSEPNKLEGRLPQKSEMSEPEKLEGRQPQKSEMSEPNKLEGRLPQKSEMSEPNKLEGRLPQKSEMSEPEKLEGRQQPVKSEVTELNNLEEEQPFKSEVSEPDKLEKGQSLNREVSIPFKLEIGQTEMSEAQAPSQVVSDQPIKNKESLPHEVENGQILNNEVPLQHKNESGKPLKSEEQLQYKEDNQSLKTEEIIPNRVGKNQFFRIEDTLQFQLINRQHMVDDIPKKKLDREQPIMLVEPLQDWLYGRQNRIDVNLSFKTGDRKPMQVEGLVNQTSLEWNKGENPVVSPVISQTDGEPSIIKESMPFSKNLDEFPSKLDTVSATISQPKMDTSIDTKTPTSSQNLMVTSFVPEVSKFADRYVRILNGQSGSTEAKFNLFPEHLGHLEVKIVSQDGQVSVQIVTDTSVAKDTLEGQLHQLRQSLQTQGLQVQKLEIIQQSPGSFDSSQTGLSFSQGGSSSSQQQPTFYLNREQTKNGSNGEEQELEREHVPLTYGGITTKSATSIDFTA